VEAGRLGDRKRVERLAVILDSNTLIMMASGAVAPSMIGEALGAAYDLYATDSVLEELERLAATHPRQTVRRLAAGALRLAERLGVKALETGVRDADDSIEAAARSLRAEGLRVVVASSDRTLRRRLRKLGVPTLYYRESEGILELEWEPL